MTKKLEFGFVFANDATPFEWHFGPSHSVNEIRIQIAMFCLDYVFLIKTVIEITFVG